MNVFFILGQPRSRTAWLANFFTYKESYCFHDATRRCATARDMRGLFEATRKSKRTRFVGDSDSGVPFLMDELMAEFPKARLALIERDTAQVLTSFKRAFPHVPDEGAALVVEKTRLALERVKEKHRPMTVRFEDLAQENVMRDLWSHCLPGLPFDRDRWVMLDGCKVEIITEKYITDFSEEAIQRLSHLIRNYQ